MKGTMTVSGKYVIVLVPENTIAYRCGERYMACIFDLEEKRLDRAVAFFKTKEKGDQFIEENPLFNWNKCK